MTSVLDYNNYVKESIKDMEKDIDFKFKNFLVAYRESWIEVILDHEYPFSACAEICKKYAQDGKWYSVSCCTFSTLGKEYGKTLIVFCKTVEEYRWWGKMDKNALKNSIIAINDGGRFIHYVHLECR